MTAIDPHLTVTNLRPVPPMRKPTIVNPRDSELAQKFRREVGQRLKARREFLGISRADMGESLGLTEEVYGQYETGHSEMVTSKLIKAAEVLDVPVAYFFDEVGDAELEDKDVMRYYKGLPPFLKPVARQQLKALFDAQDEEARDLEPKTHGKKAE